MSAKIKNERKYITIVGGQMLNKGAQAMTFILVDYFRKNFPELKSVAIIPKRYMGNSDSLAFEVTKRYSYKRILPFCIPFIRKLYIKLWPNSTMSKCLHILKNTQAMIDISGYRFGSNWGNSTCLTYLSYIALAKSFDVPVYLFPQSFGPFDFKGIKGKLVNYLSKKLFPYCKVIMAREKEGEIGLKEKYKLNNVIHISDMVLQNVGIERSNVYKSSEQKIKYVIKDNSVAIIPNSKNNIYGNSSELADVYSEIVSHLLKMKRNVYLLYHSFEDASVCEEIKSKFSDVDSVIYVKEDLSCLDFDDLLKSFDYVIASRYHSIVHAYKNNVPAIIMGWATKYHELSDSLSQSQYLLDVRNGIKANEVTDMIDKMEKSYSKESKIISEKMKHIREDNVFDYLSIK